MAALTPLVEKGTTFVQDAIKSLSESEAGAKALKAVEDLRLTEQFERLANAPPCDLGMGDATDKLKCFGSTIATSSRSNTSPLHALRICAAWGALSVRTNSSPRDAATLGLLFLVNVNILAYSNARRTTLGTRAKSGCLNMLSRARNRSATAT